MAARNCLSHCLFVVLTNILSAATRVTAPELVSGPAQTAATACIALLRPRRNDHTLPMSTSSSSPSSSLLGHFRVLLAKMSEYLDLAQACRLMRTSQMCTRIIGDTSNHKHRSVHGMLDRIRSIDTAHRRCRCMRPLWKTPPENRRLYARISHLVRVWTFMRDLDALGKKVRDAADVDDGDDGRKSDDPRAQVVAKYNLLQNNREMLVFNLRRQVRAFRVWWCDHYNLDDARVQVEEEDECEQGKRSWGSCRQIVPLCEPEFRAGVRRAVQRTGDDNGTVLVRCRDLIGRDNWNIIVGYLAHDCSSGRGEDDLTTWRMCRQCANTNAAVFLLGCLPLLSARLLQLPEVLHLCNGDCAWQLMLDHLPLCWVDGTQYVLVPCLRFAPKLCNWYSSCSSSSSRRDFGPAAPPPFVLMESGFVHDTFDLRFPHDYEVFVAQHLFSLTHQTDCPGPCVGTEGRQQDAHIGNRDPCGCWTYLPKQWLHS